MIQPELVEAESELPLYREVAWDFAAGRPVFQDGNPVFVTGKEAIKVWIWKALITPRAQYEIYSWDFGSDVRALTGQNFSAKTKQAEAVRYVREALEINPYITDVSDIRVSFDGDRLLIESTVETVYGEVDVVV